MTRSPESCGGGGKAQNRQRHGRRRRLGPLIDEAALAKVEEHVADRWPRVPVLSRADSGTRLAARSTRRRCWPKSPRHGRGARRNFRPGRAALPL